MLYLFAALSVYSVRLAILALTLIRALYAIHAISHSTHHNPGAEVAQCVISKELQSTIITMRAIFSGGTRVFIEGRRFEQTSIRVFAIPQRIEKLCIGNH